MTQKCEFFSSFDKIQNHYVKVPRANLISDRRAVAEKNAHVHPGGRLQITMLFTCVCIIYLTKPTLENREEDKTYQITRQTNYLE